MKISFIDIQNFRKLKSCRVELAAEETLFIGANNSGKTSAMDALIIFLKKSCRSKLSTTDFTLSNWTEIERVAASWIAETDASKLNFNLTIWQKYTPSLDIWLQVESDEIHYVSHLIPTLDWNAGYLGVRLSFEPKNVEELFKSYKQVFDAASDTSKKSKKKDTLKLWPRTVREFLDVNLHKFFIVNAYILDPSKLNSSQPQKLIDGAEPIQGDPFDGLFKIDVDLPPLCITV